MTQTRTALARLYRPRQFAEMATQEHVSATLRSAVARGRVGHAYLFTGPRGVGKTTAARVLAMALNCPNRSAEGEPCGECESCDRIWAGRTSLDVVEIDAASNRGVDDARDLRERALYAPTDEHRYKVYIVDEAHMLTREAWNALLKILEEPPPRVIFVFATTEPQKIQQSAAPILSRCQRFDFRRIGVHDIVARLSEVLSGEAVEAENEALLRLARRAEGGMRDALSLLDQVLSFTGGRVTGEDVRQVLGLASEELYLDLFDILAARRHADVFRFVERILDDGYDLAEFYRGLADAIRSLLLIRLEGIAGADIRDDLADRYQDAAAAFGTGDLLRMLAQVAEMDTEGRLRKAANPRLLLEALLLRFAHLDRSAELEQLIRAASGAPMTESGTPRPLMERPPQPKQAPSPSPRPSQPSQQGSPRTPANATKPASPSLSPSPAEPASQKMPASATKPASPSPSPSPAEPASPKTSANAAPPAAPTPAPSPIASVAADAQEALDRLLTQRRAPHGLGIFLKAAGVSEPEPGVVILELPPGPGIEQLNDTRKRESLRAALSEELGRTVQLEVKPMGAGPASKVAPVRLTPERVKTEKLARLASSDETLKKAVEEWNLELLD